jgi:predicted dehydrogenase
MTESKPRPRVAILGLGSYYRHLRESIARSFEVVTLSDCMPVADLNLEASEVSRFREVKRNLNGFTLDESADCAIVLTPPGHHLQALQVLAAYRKPILVEKPAVVSGAEFEALSELLNINPRIYCSDFYPDVRGAPLLAWAGRHVCATLNDKIHVASGDHELWRAGIGAIGPITRIEATLLEGPGPEGVIGDRGWLWEPSQGGVVLDLMYHHFALCSSLFEQAAIPERVTLRTIDASGNEIEWRPESKRAETYALVEGRLSGGTPFRFEVSKYWRHGTTRLFALYGSAGSAMLSFGDLTTLTLERPAARCEVLLEGNHFTHVAPCFADYVRRSDASPHGVDHARRAIEACDLVRKK